MTYEEYLLLKDPYEVSEVVRKAMEPRTVSFCGMKLVLISNVPLAPGILAHLSCGPEPEQNVWLVDSSDSGS